MLKLSTFTANETEILLIIERRLKKSIKKIKNLTKHYSRIRGEYIYIYIERERERERERDPNNQTRLQIILIYLENFFPFKSFSISESLSSSERPAFFSCLYPSNLEPLFNLSAAPLGLATPVDLDDPSCNKYG